MKAAWDTFRHIVTGFLGNVKAVNFVKLVEDLTNILQVVQLQLVTQDAFSPVTLELILAGLWCHK